MTSAYVRLYGLSGQWKVVRMDSWARGEQSFFGGKSHGATSLNYIVQLVLKKEISKQLSKKICRQSLYNFLLQLTKVIMSTNNSRKILACRRHVLSREQREGERQRATVNTRRASEGDRERERVRSGRRRQNFSEESRQVERVRARRRRENYNEKRQQAERDRARMNRQRQQNNDMMTVSVVLMSLWPRTINILISN